MPPCGARDRPRGGRPSLSSALQASLHLNHEALRSGLFLSGVRRIGTRPEELLNALRVLAYSLPVGAGPDATLQIIVATVRAGIANAEFVRIQELGPLAEGIFDRIASSPETQTRGLYSTEAMDDYSKELGRRVRSEEIQNFVQQLQGANIIMRLGHGAYTVVDPFVREMWLERKSQLSASDPG